MSNIRYWLVIFLILAVAGQAGVLTAQAASPERIDAKGVIGLVAKNRGKLVVVNFWATWCLPCREEIPSFVEVRKRYSENDVSMVGVSLDFDSRALDRFLQKYPINYQIYFGEQDVAGTFGIRGIPRTVIYDRKGEKIFTHDGYLEQAKLREVLDKNIGKR